MRRVGDVGVANNAALCVSILRSTSHVLVVLKPDSARPQHTHSALPFLLFVISCTPARPQLQRIEAKYLSDDWAGGGSTLRGAAATRYYGDDDDDDDDDDDVDDDDFDGDHNNEGDYY